MKDDRRVFDTTVKDPKSNEKTIHPVTIIRERVVAYTPSPVVPATTCVFMDGGHRFVLNVQFLDFHTWSMGGEITDAHMEEARATRTPKKDLNGTTRRK